MPVPCDEIISYGSGCKEYLSLDGEVLRLPRYKNCAPVPVSIGTPEYFAKSAEWHSAEAARCASFKSKRRSERLKVAAEQDRARIEPSRAYWAEADRIRSASGIKVATTRRETALAALKAAIDQIMMTDDWTITGTVIKAQALSAWAEADRFARVFNERGPAWADLLAASIVKHAA